MMTVARLGVCGIVIWRAKMWEVKRAGEVIAWGESEKSQPTAQELRMFREDGYKVFVDGKEVKK